MDDALGCFIGIIVFGLMLGAFAGPISNFFSALGTILSYVLSIALIGGVAAFAIHLYRLHDESPPSLKKRNRAQLDAWYREDKAMIQAALSTPNTVPTLEDFLKPLTLFKDLARMDYESFVSSPSPPASGSAGLYPDIDAGPAYGKYNELIHHRKLLWQSPREILRTLSNTYLEIERNLQRLIPIGNSPFTVSLDTTISPANAYLVLAPIWKQEIVATGFFERWRNEYASARDYFSQTQLSSVAYNRGERIDPLNYEWDSTADYLVNFGFPHPLVVQLTQQISVPIEAADRFRHQFIVGPTGSGKTTFLSAQIADDLRRVARNEASLFVMDSQNELVPDIAKLDIFSSDGPLAGKLIYLESDPDYPLALNIFDVNKERLATLSSKDRMMLESGAMWMVEFFLSSLVKAEATPHQDIFLNYLIPALMQIPDATIFTLKELLEPAKSKHDKPAGYEKYKRYFQRLRPDHQQWLAERMHSPELAVTRNAIRSRLDGFTARGFFHDMFINPRNKLDLFAELQSGKVILVNTMKGLLKSGTEPFGRFFLARILQATEERMLVDRGNRLPVFAYIDEAGDYIRDEKNIAELIDKARKQNIALTLAVQRTTDIDANVLDALKHSAIQCTGRTAPTWSISIDGADPIQAQVPNVRFQDFPVMSREEQAAMLQVMRERYASTVQDGHQSEFKSNPLADDEFPTEPSTKY